MNDDFVQLTWKMMPSLPENVKWEGEKEKHFGGNAVALYWGCCVKYVFLVDYQHLNTSGLNLSIFVCERCEE